MWLRIRRLGNDWQQRCERVGAGLERRGLDVDRLVLDELGQAYGAHLSADTTRLVATERAVETDRRGVDHEEARADAAGDAHAPLRVARPHTSPQPVGRIVG